MSHSSESPGKSAVNRPATFRAGTLEYTKGGLLLLFFWLLWGDFCQTLMEQVAPQLVPLLLKDNGAGNKEIAFLMATFGSILATVGVPIISTWSDNLRTRYGRRRPFLLLATPPTAISLAVMPFIPDFTLWLLGHSWAAKILSYSPVAPVILLLGVVVIGYTIFNMFIMSIFFYFFVDVVPEVYFSRFLALFRVVSTIAVFLFNFFLFGLAETHMKEIFVGLALLYLVFYMVATWKVKEGDYGPPQPKESLPKTIANYFRVCFRDPYFLWIFAMSVVYQTGNASNMFQIFFFRDELGLDLDTIGKMRAWPSLVCVALAYWCGSLADRFHPVRMLPWALLVWAATNLVAFFAIHGQWSMLVGLSLISVAGFFGGICQGASLPRLFPKNQYGQFSSANALVQSFAGIFTSMLVGIAFDQLPSYRLCFLWTAFFFAASAFLAWRVYRNWRTRQISLLDT
jgi:MFS family permease